MVPIGPNRRWKGPIFHVKMGSFFTYSLLRLYKVKLERASSLFTTPPWGQAGRQEAWPHKERGKSCPVKLRVRSGKL